MPYVAFISYSHAADGKLAPQLQAVIHRFARPWYRLRIQQLRSGEHVEKVHRAVLTVPQVDTLLKLLKSRQSFTLVHS